MMYVWNADHWHWPQYTVLALSAANLCCAALVHGNAKTPSKHSFPITLCAAAISLWIAWAGGFYA